MRILPVALLASLVFAPGCDTTHASVPSIAPDDARQLVLADLAELAADPSEVQWRRTYRHFDRHLEPHLAAGDRLALEVAFGNLRRELKMDRPDRAVVARLCDRVAADLQPQD